ncbi:MAG: hypothetical protein NTX63_00270 [Candidatus Peregrinibacteria bacterium]|nr:hypothetical protein [Candidatus Peregrinibacteria bacterium]
MTNTSTQLSAVSAADTVREITEVPRNWSSCVVTFPDNTAQDVVHTALRGIGHVVIRNAAKPHGYMISRDPNVESQRFFRDTMRSIQIHHGATVQVLLREPPVEPKSRLDALSSISRGFTGRVRQALRIFERN